LKLREHGQRQHLKAIDHIGRRQLRHATRVVCEQLPRKEGTVKPMFALCWTRAKSNVVGLFLYGKPNSPIIWKASNIPLAIQFLNLKGLSVANYRIRLARRR
jgi:hypothetical protein